LESSSRSTAPPATSSGARASAEYYPLSVSRPSLQAIALDDQGEILLAGYSGGTETPVVFGDGDAPTWYLVKLTSTGDLSWQQSLASPWPSLQGSFEWTLGGVDAAGEPVLVGDVAADTGPPSFTPIGSAVVTAQRFDPSGQVISTTPLALSGDTKK
jgi:hypothetical protein